MHNDSLQLKYLKEKRRGLLDFLNKDNFTGDEIRQWIGNTIVYFTEVGVPETIISYFLTSLDFTDKRGTDSGYVVSHGPFEHTLLSGYKLKKYKLTPVYTAFKVARNLTERAAEQDRVIPKFLINELERYVETKTISVSLSATQTAYENKNTKGMLAALISTTDSFAGLIPELSDIKDVGPKIKKAYETKIIYEKYSMSREILWSINNARIVRNIDIHKPADNNKTTLYEGCKLHSLTSTSNFIGA